MNISLSPATTYQPAAAENHAEATPATEAGATDSSLGKLSVNGEIRQLKEQGQNLSQISIDVDLSISTVGNDLLINVPQIPRSRRPLLPLPSPPSPSVPDRWAGARRHGGRRDFFPGYSRSFQVTAGDVDGRGGLVV